MGTLLRNARAAWPRQRSDEATLRRPSGTRHAETARRAMFDSAADARRRRQASAADNPATTSRIEKKVV